MISSHLKTLEDLSIEMVDAMEAFSRESRALGPEEIGYPETIRTLYKEVFRLARVGLEVEANEKSNA